MERRPLPPAWDELLRTGSAVRATAAAPDEAPRDPGRLRQAVRPVAISAALLTAAGLAVVHLAGTPAVAVASGSEDSRLFSLTNSDRTSNGVHSLTLSGTSRASARARPTTATASTCTERSDDMIRRNYFAHPILGCGQLVFSMMQAYGVHYRSAGENIGWNAGYADPAGAINGEFMASPDHRSNILNRNYTEMGVGSDESAPGVTWTGVGAEQNVWMFSVEFAQVGASRRRHADRRHPNPGRATRPRPRPPGGSGDHAGTGAVSDPRGGANREPSPGPARTPGGAVRGSVPQHDRIRSRSVPHFLKGQYPDSAQHRRSVCGRPRWQHRRRHRSPQGLPGEQAAA